jgi:hypothetical protein
MNNAAARNPTPFTGGSFTRITINLLIKRLRVVRSGLCINDREKMLHLINELERLEKVGYEIEGETFSGNVIRLHEHQDILNLPTMQKGKYDNAEWYRKLSQEMRDLL